jgi:hypothetical protein
MPRRSVTAPLIALITLAVVPACTSAPAATPASPSAPVSTISPTQAPESAPAETGPAETEPVETEAPLTAPPLTAPPSFDPDESLEDMFPDDIGGQPLEVESATGQGILTFMGGSDPVRVGAFLGEFGKTIDDASAAFALGFVPGETATDIRGVSILGLRVADVPADQLVTGFTGLVTAEAPNSDVSEETIGGKQVTVIVDPDEGADQAVNLYGVGDVVFIVGGTPDLVEEAIGKLP